MKSLKKFRVSLIFLTIWAICFGIFLLTRSGLKYAPTIEDAKKLGGFMNECSGDVISYTAGYRCDAYGPNALMMIIILIGIASFMIALFSFVYVATSLKNSY